MSPSAKRTPTAGSAPAAPRVIAFEEYHCVPSAASERTAPLSVLVLSHVRPFNAATIHDHCASLSAYSRHRCRHFNPIAKSKPAWLDLDRFDAIAIHYSINSVCDWFLDASWVRALAASRACKVMFIQDEYSRVNAYVGRMRELGIDLLWTCVPRSEVRKVYAAADLPATTIACTLTGFVPERLARRAPNFQVKRPIDVGYRARDIGYWYGELARDKVTIGRRFQELAAGRGLACDISTREEDRIYGRAWLRFLRSCRCTLGTPSGASVFDFTGRIEHDTREYLATHPDATFEQVRARFFPEEDGRVRMGQISPRVFESIACGACLVLFEGEYSGVVQPDLHYIPLKRDFGNFAEVVEKIKDPAYTTAMARRAYEDVIAPGRYSYRRFAEGFDRVLELAAIRKQGLAPACPGSNSEVPQEEACPSPFPDSPYPDSLLPDTFRIASNDGRAARLGLLRRVARALTDRQMPLAERAKQWAIRVLTDWRPMYVKDRLRLYFFRGRRARDKIMPPTID